MYTFSYVYICIYLYISAFLHNVYIYIHILTHIPAPWASAALSPAPEAPLPFFFLPLSVYYTTFFGLWLCCVLRSMVRSSWHAAESPSADAPLPPRAREGPQHALVLPLQQLWINQPERIMLSRVENARDADNVDMCGLSTTKAQSALMVKERRSQHVQDVERKRKRANTMHFRKEKEAARRHEDVPLGDKMGSVGPNK